MLKPDIQRDHAKEDRQVIDMLVQHFIVEPDGYYRYDILIKISVYEQHCARIYTSSQMLHQLVILVEYGRCLPRDFVFRHFEREQVSIEQEKAMPCAC